MMPATSAAAAAGSPARMEARICSCWVMLRSQRSAPPIFSCVRMMTKANNGTNRRRSIWVRTGLPAFSQSVRWKRRSRS